MYSDEYSKLDRDIDKEYQEKVIKWGKHYHWIDFHRVCAVCGKLIKSGELESVMNDGKISIKDNYTDEYKKVKQDDKFGHLLMVHKKCLETFDEGGDK